MGGGSGYRGSDRGSGVELLLLESGLESEASLLASDLGGEGGNRRLVRGNSVPGFFVCVSAKGGESGMVPGSVGMIRGGIERQ